MPDWITATLGCLMLAMGWWPCCCNVYCQDAACTACAPGTPDGGGPANYEVVVSGFANDLCTGCAGYYDGTFTAPYDGGILALCTWKLETANASAYHFTFCTTDTRRVIVQVVDLSGSGDRSSVRVTVSLRSSNSEQHDYVSSLEDKPDCCGYVDEACSYVGRSSLSGTFACDGSGATVTVSSA